MDFLKSGIAGELLVVSTCNLYQTNLCQVDYRSMILYTEHILSYIFAVNYYCELLFIKGKW